MENIHEKSEHGKENLPHGETVKAFLKWFNAPKGFGFVNPETRKDVDAFLHITTLQAIGFQALGEGACILCEIEYGDKGANVKQVFEVIDPGKLPENISSDERIDDEQAETLKMEGSVKWYKPEEGFGFITPDDGLKDVFIHKTCLDRHEISSLEAGQRVFMTFRNVPKGREVVSFKIIDEKD